LNLFWCGKHVKSRICEIGFNAGHSALLFLLGKEKTAIDFTIFDIGHHPYTKRCLEYLGCKFDNVQFEYIEGDSTATMEEWIEKNKMCIGTYDLIHVDGGHSEYCIINDMKNADILVKINGILIIDDTYHTHINRQVESYLSRGNYKELTVLNSGKYSHRIIKKLNNIK